ncbi:MAG: hypothetical protein O2877_01100 [bacterium]|nr:hypothetical protein [bacterium]
MIRIELGPTFSSKDVLSEVRAKIIQSGYAAHDVKGLFPRIEFCSNSESAPKLDALFTADQIQYYRHLSIYITENSDG